MGTTMAETHNKPRMGRVPIVPIVYCAGCEFPIAQAYQPWSGAPLWIQCRKCRAMNRVSADGVWVVAQAGDVQPKARRCCHD